MALRLDSNVRDATPYYMLMLDRVRKLAEEFDILHFHIDQYHFPLFAHMADCTVTTLHGRQDLPDLKPLKQTPKVKVFLDFLMERFGSAPWRNKRGK